MLSIPVFETQRVSRRPMQLSGGLGRNVDCPDMVPELPDMSIVVAHCRSRLFSDNGSL